MIHPPNAKGGGVVPGDCGSLRGANAIWIIDAAREQKAVHPCIEGLTKTAFHGKQFKVLQSPPIG